MKRLIILLAAVTVCLGFSVTAGADPNLSEMISDANDGLGDLASDARDEVSDFFDGVGDMSNGMIGDESRDTTAEITELPTETSDITTEVTELPEASSAEITELSSPIEESIPDTDTPSTGDFGVVGFGLAALAASVVAHRVSNKKLHRTKQKADRKFRRHLA